MLVSETDSEVVDERVSQLDADMGGVSEAVNAGLDDDDADEYGEAEPEELDEADSDTSGDVDDEVDEEDDGSGGADGVANGSPVTVTVIVITFDSPDDAEMEADVDPEMRLD